MEKIKTGLLGSGGAARIHANALKLCPDREFVGIFSLDQEGAQIFAREYGVTAFETKEALFASCECIHICTPSGTHYEDTMECLQRGKHVVCEKPVCMTSEQCDMLEKALEKSDAKYMPISQHRFSEAYHKVKKALENGDFGKILHAGVEVMYYREPKYYSDSNWRGTIKNDGGVLMNQGIHEIDVLVGLLGKPLRVWAVAGRMLHDIEAPDTVNAFVTFEKGCTAQIAVTTAAAPGFPARHFLFGTKGMTEVVEDRIVKWQTEGADEEVCGQENDLKSGMSNPLGIDMTLHAVQFREFSDLIRGGGTQNYTAEDAFTTIRLLDAIFVSANEQRMIDLA